MAAEKLDIRSMELEEITSFMKENGVEAYRGKQVFEWLWKKSAQSFQEMTNLGTSLRSKLEANFFIDGATVEKHQVSADGTVKSGIRLHDKHLVESVLIPTEKRITACISSQVGCSLTCSFCATGKLKRIRNLSAGEIYDQVVRVKEQAHELYQRPLTNIVYMGMGEPLLNYKQVVRSIALISGKEGLDMASRRITLSTAGIAKKIEQLGEDGIRCKLALSLHAATDEKRNKIMPINEQNNLAKLSQAILRFYEQTKNPITVEYILLGGFNDSREDAQQLIKWCKRWPCKVNLIEYNPIDQGSFTATAAKTADQFAQWLIDSGVPCSLRRSRGKDIDAACGQLANKIK